jgi:DNA-binding MarR family transcriptional regulator
MKPLEILHRYQGSISLIDECVLEQIVLLEDPVTTQTVINQCLALKIASPATAHKALTNLSEAGFIKVYRHPLDHDNRKRWITFTAAGERRIKDMA